MPKNTTSKKTTATKTGSKTAPNPTRATRKTPSARTVTWTGAERAPRKRWWWWAVVIYLTVLGVAAALSYHQWMLAVLITVMMTALLVAYGSKPRTRQYKLTGTTLTIDETSYDLTRFDRSVREDPWMNGSSTVPGETLLFLPKARFGLPLSVFLPDEKAKNEAVSAALSKYVPPADRSGYKGVLRVLDQIARWFRL